MSKSIRVYQLARELEVESKELLRLLNDEMNIDVNNHMSTINDQVARRLRQLVRGDEPQSATNEGKADSAPVPQKVPVPKEKTSSPRAASATPAPKPKEEHSKTGAQEQAAGTAARTNKVQRRGSIRTSDLLNRGGSGGRGGDEPVQESRESRETRKRESSRPAPASPPVAAPVASGDGKPGGDRGRRRGRGPQVDRGFRERERNLPGKRQGRRGGANRQQQAPVKPRTPEKITLEGPITVGEFSSLIGLPVNEIIKQLMLKFNVMATINVAIDAETAGLLAMEYGTEVEINEPEPEPDDEELLLRSLQGDSENLQPRPPVVTVLGHVDHGKTSLLDAIRETSVTTGEAGGITQHIGASVVERDGYRIVLLDTPGHEAFTAMRARGAKVTDIAVLVVAADDGVMPQTIEAISHARDADVPIVVAINKMDKPTAQPDRVKQQLSEHGLIPEDWGGDTIMVPVSSLRREGIDELLEMIHLVAEVRDLKADPTLPAIGTVIEAQMDKGRGPVATILVQAGTLRTGDAFVVGQQYGKVRAMMDDRGRAQKEAGPSIPVEVLGLNDVPEAGDIFRVVEDERTARAIAESRRLERREEEMQERRSASLSDFFKRMEEGETRELKLVVKADVQGSLEAVRSSLEQLEVEDVRVSVIHAGVGSINESDVMLASTGSAVIVGFNVRPDGKARLLAEREQVEIQTYRVIYDLLNDIESALKGLLDPEYEEVILGRAEVRKVIRVPGVGNVAGCYVTDGKVQRNANARLLRDGTIAFEGGIASLKRFQDDVREVAQNYECGISLERFNDIKEGDVIEVYTSRLVER